MSDVPSKVIFWPSENSPGPDSIVNLTAGFQSATCTLICHHPTGRQSSSFWFHDRPWLTYNSIQSGHFIDTKDFQLVGADYARTPIKPTIDIEPGYENITDGPVGTPGVPRLQAADVGRSEYLDVFAGAAGLTYGQGEVYGFGRSFAASTSCG